MGKYPHLAIALNGPITLNITRTVGRSDVSIPINLQKDKPEVSLQFSKCVIQLLNSL
jgi:hypothetical protein